MWSCRAYADQVIGTTFIELLKKNIMELPVYKLFYLERALDKVLRKENNTIVCMSIKDVYYTVDHYKGIFELSNEVLKLKKTERSEDLLELLNDYFRAGLPKDITNTIDSQVLSLLGEGIDGKG